ncbi:thioredoxin family protein [Coxiella endosymbiont of Amblyomma nuttalli]|uniref:thioredoxin family protein n=1 Tax=Coxiella endosymbiont of Amblyomma nuttalli TaxID=2749996 RepID=UPI001BA77033|nr:thioredoxin family protein [Coxiella endosymbiont of Amblyomma nuttalli]QTS83968.1 Thiol-disulfide oxidoreductase ResA [Coxiella endosymbiont of Amblyomma nuttalli]
MALIPSTTIPLNTKAHQFELVDTVSGKTMSLNQLKSDKATVIMFICNHCPFVQHIQGKLTEIARRYQTKGVQFVAINSNDIANYPEDAPEKMKEVAEKFGYSFPYLFDKTQEVAKAYQAACTPDFYIYDKNLVCVYHGRFDASSPGRNTQVTGEDLCHALNNLLTGKQINPDQKPSQGCNIKWIK